MTEFAESYLGKLRAIVGSRLILTPGARLVLFKATSEVLLQRRADFGTWGFIGGIPEERESLTEMIVRETMEEVGVTIRTPVPFGFSSNPALETITYPNGDQCQAFAMMFACDKFAGEPKPADEESTATQWVHPDRLPSDCMPSVRPTLEAFLRWRSSGEFQMLD
jgi:8-oxo-dGTP pyrophosphatase MutT (NUDIX family)